MEKLAEQQLGKIAGGTISDAEFKYFTGQIITGKYNGENVAVVIVEYLGMIEEVKTYIVNIYNGETNTILLENYKMAEDKIDEIKLGFPINF